MTISEIIEINETNMENLEEMTQIPKSHINELNILYDELNSKLGELVDTYGDDADVDSESEDNW